MVNRTDRNVVAHWDAGETGCGQLIVGLKQRLSVLNPGDVLEVVARDAGAPIDLFVWCRMTGHALLSESHPVYLIQRRAYRAAAPQHAQLRRVSCPQRKSW